MEIEIKEIKTYGIKVIALENGDEIGRAYIYFMSNDLHNRPFAYLEDVYVNEEFRGKGISRKILDKIKELAKERNCYKIVATSRYEREFVHNYYERIGYNKTGHSFRMDLE